MITVLFRRKKFDSRMQNSAVKIIADFVIEKKHLSDKCCWGYPVCVRRSYYIKEEGVLILNW